MSENRIEKTTIYEIRIAGHLSDYWEDWFEGMTITATANGETTLTGVVVDQSALFGLLKKVRDTGLKLIAVTPIDSNEA